MGWLIALVVICLVGALVLGILALLKPSPVPQPSNTGSRLQEQAEVLQRLSNATRGGITSTWHQGNSKSRAELDGALNLEIGGKADLHRTTATVMEAEHHVKETPKRLAQDEAHRDKIHQGMMARQQNENTIITNATNANLTIENEALRQRTDLDVQKQEKLNVLSRQEKDADSKRKVWEQKKNRQNELKNTVKEMQERVKWAIVMKHFTNQQMDMLYGELLDQLYTEIEEIEKSKWSDKTKKRMIDDRENLITHFKEQRNGIRVAGPAHSNAGKVLEGGHPTIDLRRHKEADKPKPAKPPSAKNTGSRGSRRTPK